MNHRNMLRHAQWIPAVLAVAAAAAWAAENSPTAPPPKFDQAQVDDIFFPDARKQLVGTPPAAGQLVKVTPGGATGVPQAPGSAAAPAAAGAADGNAWSSLVSAETLESEIKAQPAAIDAAMKSTNQQKAVRLVMTELAALFGVVMKYDKDVRWKEDGQALRDEFAKAGNNLKAWTDSQKRQVAKVQTDLKDLIQGNKPSLSTSLDAEIGWKDVADFSPVMHRLEQAQQERLAGWSKDADAVKKNKDAIVREAELVAMLARIIQDKSYELGSDAEYQKFAKELESQAVTAVAAAKGGDGAACSSAVSKIQKACDDCHGAFR
jgi:hypothetical protein